MGATQTTAVAARALAPIRGPGASADRGPFCFIFAPTSSPASVAAIRDRHAFDRLGQTTAVAARASATDGRLPIWPSRMRASLGPQPTPFLKQRKPNQIKTNAVFTFAPTSSTAAVAAIRDRPARGRHAQFVTIAATTTALRRLLMHTFLA